MTEDWTPIALAAQQTPYLVCRRGLMGWHAIAILSPSVGWVYYGDLGGPEAHLKYTPTHFQELDAPPRPLANGKMEDILRRAANPLAKGKWYAHKGTAK